MIFDANSSGQGYDPDHRGGRVIHHTYKRGARSISAWNQAGWRWSGTARPGSGHHYTGKTLTALATYLKNAKNRG